MVTRVRTRCIPQMSYLLQILRELPRNAHSRHSQEEKAEVEERRARDLARRQWKASGGTEAAFDRAWLSMWEEMLERVMNLSENRVEMRIQQSAWFPRDFRFPHS
jgi:hypothetical protein